MTEKCKEDGKIATIFERPDRFEAFAILIDTAHKCISKIKQELCDGDATMKSVHTLWLYELYKHKGGLTASELAEKSNIDRSLISREIRALVRSGYVTAEPAVGKRSYNSLITLTEKGTATAVRIAAAAHEFQLAGGKGIDDAALASFYDTLNKICDNLNNIADR